MDLPGSLVEGDVWLFHRNLISWDQLKALLQQDLVPAQKANPEDGYWGAESVSLVENSGHDLGTALTNDWLTDDQYDELVILAPDAVMVMSNREEAEMDKQDRAARRWWNKSRKGTTSLDEEYEEWDESPLETLLSRPPWQYDEATEVEQQQWYQDLTAGLLARAAGVDR